MIYKYNPSGVCSKELIIDMDEDHVINSLEVVGGCPGNLLGISSMVKGMKAEDVIKKFKGIKCGYKGTSCPDQIASALEEIIEN